MSTNNIELSNKINPYEKKVSDLLFSINRYRKNSQSENLQQYRSDLAKKCAEFKRRSEKNEELFLSLEKEFLIYQKKFYAEWSYDAVLFEEDILLSYLINVLEELSQQKDNKNFISILRQSYLNSTINNKPVNLLKEILQNNDVKKILYFPEDLADSNSPIVHFINAELKNFLSIHQHLIKKIPVGGIKVIENTKENLEKEPFVISDEQLKKESIYHRKKATEWQGDYLSLYLGALWLYRGGNQINNELEKSTKTRARHKKIASLLKFLMEKNYRPAKHLRVIRLGETGNIASPKETKNYDELLLENIDYPPSLLALAARFLDCFNSEKSDKKSLLFIEYSNDILWRLSKLADADHSSALKMLASLKEKISTLKNKSSKSEWQVQLLTKIDEEFKEKKDEKKNLTLQINTQQNSTFLKELSKKNPRRLQDPDFKTIEKETNFYLSIFYGPTIVIGLTLGIFIGNTLLPVFGVVPGAIMGTISFATIGFIGQLILNKISSGSTYFLDMWAKKYSIHLPLADKRTLLSFSTWFSIVGATLGGLIPTVPIIGNALGILGGSLAGASLGGIVGGVILLLGKSLGLKSSDMLSSTQRAIGGGVIFGFIATGICFLLLLSVGASPSPFIIIPVTAISILLGGLAVGLISIGIRQLRHRNNPFPEKNYFDRAENTNSSNSEAAVKWALNGSMLVALLNQLPTPISALINATVILVAYVTGYTFSYLNNRSNKPKLKVISQMEELRESRPEIRENIEEFKPQNQSISSIPHDKDNDSVTLKKALGNCFFSIKETVRHKTDEQRTFEKIAPISKTLPKLYESYQGNSVFFHKVFEKKYEEANNHKQLSISAN